MGRRKWLRHACAFTVLPATYKVLQLDALADAYDGSGTYVLAGTGGVLIAVTLHAVASTLVDRMWKNDQALYREALENIDMHRWRVALELMTSAIHADPSNAKYYKTRAECYLRLQLPDKAWEDYSKYRDLTAVDEPLSDEWRQVARARTSRRSKEAPQSSLYHFAARISERCFGHQTTWVSRIFIIGLLPILVVCIVVHGIACWCTNLLLSIGIAGTRGTLISLDWLAVNVIEPFARLLYHNCQQLIKALLAGVQYMWPRIVYFVTQVVPDMLYKFGTLVVFTSETIVFYLDCSYRSTCKFIVRSGHVCHTTLEQLGVIKMCHTTVHVTNKVIIPSITSWSLWVKGIFTFSLEISGKTIYIAYTKALSFTVMMGNFLHSLLVSGSNLLTRFINGAVVPFLSALGSTLFSTLTLIATCLHWCWCQLVDLVYFIATRVINPVLCFILDVATTIWTYLVKIAAWIWAWIVIFLQYLVRNIAQPVLSQVKVLLLASFHAFESAIFWCAVHTAHIVILSAEKTHVVCTIVGQAAIDFTYVAFFKFLAVSADVATCMINGCWRFWQFIHYCLYKFLGLIVQGYFISRRLFFQKVLPMTKATWKFIKDVCCTLGRAAKEAVIFVYGACCTFVRIVYDVYIYLYIPEIIAWMYVQCAHLASVAYNAAYQASMLIFFAATTAGQWIAFVSVEVADAAFALVLQVTQLSKALISVTVSTSYEIGVELQRVLSPR